MAPEVRTFVERATAHRQLLDQLLDVIPNDYWACRAHGEEWSARNHLEHLATAEDLLVEDLRRVIAGESPVWLGGSSDAEVVAKRRVDAMEAVAAESVSALRGRMDVSRERTLLELARIGSSCLEAALLAPGVTGRWGEPLRLTLRDYLAAWPSHDSEHEAAIRWAISAPPDLTAVALTRRRSPN